MSRRHPRAVLDELEQAGVKLLVDVRAVAASRRPGFSKNQLAAGLDERGISYLHLRGLGTPKDGREAARSGQFAALHKIYAKHLKTPQARKNSTNCRRWSSRRGRSAFSATSAITANATGSGSPKSSRSVTASGWRIWRGSRCEASYPNCHTVIGRS